MDKSNKTHQTRQYHIAIGILPTIHFNYLSKIQY